jgi:hypothetical protein
MAWRVLRRESNCCLNARSRQRSWFIGEFGCHAYFLWAFADGVTELRRPRICFEGCVEALVRIYGIHILSSALSATFAIQVVSSDQSTVSELKLSSKTASMRKAFACSILVPCVTSPGSLGLPLAHNESSATANHGTGLPSRHRIIKSLQISGLLHPPIAAPSHLS